MSTSHKPAFWLRLTVVLVLAMLSSALYSYLGRARDAVASGQELDYGEGTVLWQARNLTDLPHAVHPFGVYPFVLFNYTPVYHAATRLMNVFVPDLLASGRLVSVLSMLGICLLAGGIVFLATRSGAGLAAGLMAGLFLLCLPNTDWSLLMRVDLIALLFTYGGLFLFVCSLAAQEGAGRPHLVYAAFASFTLALYSRQTLIAAPAACLVFLFLENRWRAVRVGVVFAVASAAVLVTLSGLTGGEWVRHWFAYNVSPFHWRHGMWLALDQGRKSAPVLILAMICLVTAQGLTKLLFSIYLLFCSFTSLSIAKVGANVNYLLEFLFACCVLAALGVEWQLRTGSNVRRFAVLAVAAAMSFMPGSAVLARPDHGLDAARRQMLQRLAGLPGDVYSEEMTLLVEGNREVPAEPASVTFLSAIHLWNETPLVSRLDRGYFSAVIVTSSLDNAEHFSPAAAAAVEARYELREKIGPYRIYLPRTAAEAARRNS